VYLSGSGRETTAKKGRYLRTGVESTGAKAVKFKIGGAHGATTAMPHRGAPTSCSNCTEKLGGKVALMADANGSYDAANAIAIGKRIQEMKFLWFEEPCPWEDKNETKAVATR